MSLLSNISYRVPGQTACDSFGVPAKLQRYNNAICKTGEGLDRGEPTEYNIIIEVQPLRSITQGEELKLKPEGHNAQAMHTFYYNPNDARNVDENGNPIYLVTSESRYKFNDFDSSSIQHSDTITYLGETLIVANLRAWTGNTCVNEHTELLNNIDHQSGTLEGWQDEYTERSAKRVNDQFTYEGDFT